MRKLASLRPEEARRNLCNYFCCPSYLPGMSASLDVALIEIADDDLLARGDPCPGVHDQLVAFEVNTCISK